ncbi:MAG TPA: cobalamin-binding protein [Pyrinomonadaceae bacterium]|nr:cobalamin-binding protein [Pyrinomonadaceae bacterium]HMP64499.1 cobalamin-binding protein [Pyrinomonadaceae bacterium]
MSISAGCDRLYLMRIVSLLPSATEIVCALGLEGRLIAVTHECDFPSGIDARPQITSSRISHETMSSSEIDHAVRSQLDGHGSIYDLDTALLAELKPDLIITQELCDVCAVSYKTVSSAAKMFTADAHVVSLEPNTIEDIFSNILTVGGLAGIKERADEVVSELRERLDRLREQTAVVEDDPRVMMLEWLEPPFAPGHWVPEQVEAAGGECVLGRAGERSVATSYEAILEADPDVLVMIPCGFYIKDTIRQLEKTQFPAKWRRMKAIEQGNIWAMDATSYFSRPGPRVVDGAELLAGLLHPGVFSEPDNTQAVRLEKNLLRFRD